MSAYGSHAVAAYTDPAGIAIAAEWECKGNGGGNAGAESALFTFLGITPVPDLGFVLSTFHGGRVPSHANDSDVTVELVPQ